MRSSFCGADFCPDKEKSAENTCCIFKDFDAVWAEISPQKPAGFDFPLLLGEFEANGVDNKLSHVRGTISMARSQKYDSASSQFFIVHKDSTFLDGQYAAFGSVTEGMEIVDAICESAKPVDNNGTIPAQEQPVIEAVRVID